MEKLTNLAALQNNRQIGKPHLFPTIQISRQIQENRRIISINDEKNERKDRIIEQARIDAEAYIASLLPPDREFLLEEEDHDFLPFVAFVSANNRHKYEYYKPTSIVQRTSGYLLHYTPGSSTTLGCIKMAQQDVEYLAQIIEYFMGRNNQHKRIRVRIRVTHAT